MPTVIADEVQVIAGDADRTGELRTPEPDQGPTDVLELELRLTGGGLNQVHARLAPARGPQEQMLNCPSDADADEAVLGAAAGVQLPHEIVPVPDAIKLRRVIHGEVGHHSEGCQFISRRQDNGPIAACMEALAVEHDHLAIKSIEGAQSEIAMPQHILDLHAALKYSLDNRTGC